MRDLQLEIGTTEPFFALDPDTYTYITENTRWLYTWKSIKEFAMKLKIIKFWTPTPAYLDDKNVMSTALNNPTYSGKQRYRL